MSAWAELNLKDKSTILTSWIGLISLIIGGAGFLFGYIDRENGHVSDRKKASMEMFHLYNRDEYVELRGAYFSLKTAALESADAVVANVDAIRALVRGEALRLMKTGDNPKISRLVDYFDAANTCAEVEICDAEVLRALLGQQAEDINDVLAEYVKMIRTSQPQFGAGLASLAEGA